MRVPLSWLEDFTPVEVDPRDREAVAALGRVLDSLGLVVEGVDYVGGGLDGVVLARVLEIGAIDGADKIRRILVDAGDPEPLEIVCGAWNFAVGDVVPLARVGTELPNGLTIARRKLRGVTSDGMLCSAPELGLGDDAAGLLVLASAGADGAPLPAGMELGAPLADHLGIHPDAVFDLAIEANRPDALSVAGIARDLAARLGRPFSLPEPSVVTAGTPAHELATARVAAPAGCRQLLARVLLGGTDFPSPPAVARRLVLAGMRPLGALVDASNYAMLELGQPSHPYDLDRLGGGGIAVRFARPGEELVTLDGNRRVLGRYRNPAGVEVDVDDLVITDADDVPVGLAGIMGGASSEIADGTGRVLLEVAEFVPVVVARTAKRQGMRSEASARFERGVDPAGLSRAADRVCELVARAAEAAGVPAPTVAPGDVVDRPVPTAPSRVRLRLGRLNALLGTELDATATAALLAPIGFRVEAAGDALEVEVPTFRPDVEREVDVVEEVARHYGYERIAPTRRSSPNVGALGAQNVRRRRLRRVLSGLGAHEGWTPPIVDPAVEARAGVHPGGGVELANPMAKEESALRRSLLPGLLGALRTNAGHRNPAVRLFEIGRVFAADPVGGDLPVEAEHVGLALAGEGDDATAAVAAWRAVADALLLEPGAVALDQRPGEDRSGLLLALHPGRRALLRAGATGEPLGALGEVDPGVLAAFGLLADRGGTRRVGWLVLDVAALGAAEGGVRLAKPVSRFPSSDIDLAFVLRDELAADELSGALRMAAGELCESIRLLDVFRGAGLGAGTRSLTFRLRFCALDRTLTDAEVAELRGRCIEAAEAELGARLRG